MTRTRGVRKATREPVAPSRKPVAKDYGANGEYAMTAYERRRLERKGLLPPGAPPPGAVPGVADRDATPASQDVAGHSAGDVQLLLEPPARSTRMDEQDAGTLTTLTLTLKERSIIAHSLMLTSTMLDALEKFNEAREALEVWERVSPDWPE